MIDIELEQLLDLREASRHRAFLHRGRPVHISCVYRWVKIGARAVSGHRIQLETVRVPSGLRTSHQAITRFVQALTTSREQCETAQGRQKQIALAEKELADEGFELT